jgi:hypothetical protein
MGSPCWWHRRCSVKKVQQRQHPFRQAQMWNRREHPEEVGPESSRWWCMYCIGHVMVHVGTRDHTNTEYIHTGQEKNTEYIHDARLEDFFG